MIIKSFFIFLAVFLLNKNSLASISCNQYTEKIAKEYKIPNKLLTSISLVESGLKKGENFVSWPWTLNVSGKSKFFESKDETVSFLKKNYNKKKNIDVGLRSLYTKHKTWNEAISRYHSSIPKRKKKYLKKVQDYWADLRQKKIKTDVVVELDEITKRERKIKYFRNEFKKRSLLDTI